MDKEAEKIIGRYGELQTDKQTLLSQLQEIGDYGIPTFQNMARKQQPGAKKMQRIFSSTAIFAHTVWTNGLCGLLTPESYPWFEITTKNKALADIPSVKRWLSYVSETMRATINTSNAQSALKGLYGSLGFAGCGCNYIDEGKTNVLNFQNFSIAKVCIEEGPEGMVDSVYRMSKFSARNCKELWGNKCSESIKKAAEKEPGKDFEILHCVKPRDNHDSRKMDALSMPFGSWYIEKETGNILEEGGYNEFPYQFPRLVRSEDEPYGATSPAREALAEIKMLNQMRYDGIKARQKRMDPPLVAKKETLSSTRTSPGSVIYYTGDAPPTPMTFGGDVRYDIEAENVSKEEIKQIFFTDLFLLFAQLDKTQMTIPEVRERLEEKLELLGPMLGSLKSELFNPMLSRSFWIMYRKGFLPPAPQELVGEGLEIEYTSKLAMAMKKVETKATTDTLSFVGGMAQFAPEVLDNFNADEIVTGTASRNGMPVKYMRSPDDVAQIRQSRAAAQKKAEEDQAMRDMAAQAPGLAKAPEPGSIQERLIGGAQQ